jgi:hypothetical protein
MALTAVTFSCQDFEDLEKNQRKIRTGPIQRLHR